MIKIEFGTVFFGKINEDFWELNFDFETRQRFDFLFNLNCKYKKSSDIKDHKSKCIIEFQLNRKNYVLYENRFPKYESSDDMNWISISGIDDEN